MMMMMIMLIVMMIFDYDVGYSFTCYLAIAAPSEAAKADTSGCYLMEGMLMKSNSSKEWKDRYGKLVNR